MAQIRDLDAGKIYIGPENPKQDQSTETLDGDKEFEGVYGLTKIDELERLFNFLIM